MVGHWSQMLWRNALTSVALCSLALSSGGCEVEPVSATQKNIDTFALTQRKVDQARTQVGSTLVALGRYCARPGRADYDAFVDGVRATQSTGDALRDIAAVMADQGNAFFGDWEREIEAMTDERLKKRTSSQKSYAQAAFKRIDVQAPALRAAYNKFVGDLNNLQTYFDYDKTAAGVGAASALIATTKADGAELERQLDLQSANLRQLTGIFVGMRRG